MQESVPAPTTMRSAAGIEIKDKNFVVTEKIRRKIAFIKSISTSPCYVVHIVVQLRLVRSDARWRPAELSEISLTPAVSLHSNPVQTRISFLQGVGVASYEICMLTAADTTFCSFSPGHPCTSLKARWH